MRPPNGQRPARGLRHRMPVLIAFAALLCAVPRPASLQTPLPSDQERAGAAAKRSAERLRALEREADALAAQQRTLVVELRALEVDRQISIEQLARIERERLEAQSQLDAAESRAAALARDAESQIPEVEARLVQLYKQGRAGYWRLLLNADDLRALGRAYRTAAMLTALDRARIDEHFATLDALADERKALQARTDELATLQGEAVSARAALDKAVGARTALMKSIDARRDLTAQLIGELQTAQERLQASLTRMEPSGAPALPLRPFQGDLPWPARGTITRPFGRQPDTGSDALVVRNGMEIGLPEGQPVGTVHDGTVAFAGQFTGYGNLVIVEHGPRSHSVYGYLGVIEVSTGERLDAQARVGTSGRNPGGNPALYFELRVDGTAVNPVQWLRR